jgi:hypothetical protein
MPQTLKGAITLRKLTEFSTKERAILLQQLVINKLTLENSQETQLDSRAQSRPRDV